LPQPPYDANIPNQYPPEVYEHVRTVPDAVFWNAVDSNPPVRLGSGDA
jgi:hypothetical protein